MPSFSIFSLNRENAAPKYAFFHLSRLFLFKHSPSLEAIQTWATYNIQRKNHHTGTSSSPLSIHHFHKDYCNQCGGQCSNNTRHNNRRRIYAPVLAAVRNNGYRYQLQEDMFIIKKVHISLLAVTGGFPVLLHSSSFSFCSSSMAFSPAGVQAQPSPRILAIILVEIYSLAAWFPGIRGKRKEIKAGSL